MENTAKKKRLENLIYPDISDSQAVLRGFNEETDSSYNIIYSMWDGYSKIGHR